MEFEITQGFLMYWGGIAGAVLTLVGSIIYFSVTAQSQKAFEKTFRGGLLNVL